MRRFRPFRFVPLWVAAAAVVAPVALAGTSPDDLIRLIPDFYLTGINTDPTNTSHTPHFLDAPGFNFPATNSVIALTTAAGNQASTFPLGTSSGGFTYQSDAATGTERRSSQTFGPLFSERAITLGKNKFNVGVTFSHLTFDRFANRSLRGGDLQFILRHEDTTPVGTFPFPQFEGDIVATQLRLKMTVDTAVVFFNYGITDRIDLGIALPWVDVELDSAVDQTIERLATGSANTHNFDGALGSTTTRVLEDSDSGIGDVLLRGKFHVLEATDAGKTDLGIGVEVRVPTGDELNLRGVGVTQVEGTLIGSWDINNFSPHFNIGYTFSDGDYDVSFADVTMDDLGNSITPPPDFVIEPADEVGATVGFDVAFTERVTFSGDLLWRRLLDALTIDAEQQTFQFVPPDVVSSNPPDPAELRSVARTQIVPMEADLDSFLAAGVLKINTGGGVLLNFGLLVPVGNNDGLQDNWSGVFGVEFNY